MKYFKYLFVLIVCKSFAQDLTGYTFVDKDLVSGVEITNERTLKSTISDSDGKFILTAEIGDKLNFAHPLIEKKTVTIQNDDILKVFLKPNSNHINEVVVESSNFQKSTLRKSVKPKYIETAFGPIKVSTAGYSNTYLSKEKIEKFNGFSLQRALSGRVPNYNNVPGKGAYLGRNSETAIWDIDGSIFQGQPPLIDLNLVEEVYVIRSLSAITKYGTIANGGVIIVRTLLSDNLNSENELSKLDHYKVAKNEEVVSLDNLYELVSKDTIDSGRLRFISLRYQENGQKDLALRLNRFIASKDTENISSVRALAESYLKKDNRIQALNIYTAFLDRKPNLNEKSFNIIYNDMLHIYNALSYIEKQNINFEIIKNREEHPNTRIVFEWSVPNEMLFVEFLDSKNKSMKMQLGDGFKNNIKVEEFFLDDVDDVDDSLKLNLSLVEKNQMSGFLKVTIYKNWLSGNGTTDIKLFDLSKIKESNYELLDLAYNF